MIIVELVGLSALLPLFKHIFHHARFKVMVKTTPSTYLVLLASTCLLLLSNIATHTVEAKASHGGARDFPHIVDKRAPQAAAATTTLAPIRGGNTKCNNLGIPPLDAALISKVKANLAATGGDSWVSGTRCVCLFSLLHA